MKNWVTTVAVALLLLAPGRAAFADRHEGADEADEAGKIYLDEEYDQGRDWAIGIGFGLVELGDNFVQGGVAVADDDVEQYMMLNLRIPVGHGNARSSGGFRGYLEPELGYWESSTGTPGQSSQSLGRSDLLLGLNIVGVMPFNAVDFFIGAGAGIHFIDQDIRVFTSTGSIDASASDEAVGVNAHFGVDVGLSRKVSLFGVGRFDIVDDQSNSLDAKAYLGLRFRFGGGRPDHWDPDED